MWENIIEYQDTYTMASVLNELRTKYEFKVQSITPCPHKEGYVFCYLARREKPVKK